MGTARRRRSVLRDGSVLLRLSVRLLPQQRGRPDPARAHCGAGHLHPVHARRSAQQRFLSPPAGRDQLSACRGLHRDFGGGCRVHAYRVLRHGHGACRYVESGRHDHGRPDDAADHGVRPQALPAAVHTEHPADPLRGLRQLRTWHVLPSRPELGAHRHRDECRDHHRYFLQPAAAGTHADRIVRAGAERAACFRLRRFDPARRYADRSALPARAAPGVSAGLGGGWRGQRPAAGRPMRSPPARPPFRQ